MSQPLTEQQIDSYAILAITADHTGERIDPAVVTVLVDEVRKLQQQRRFLLGRLARKDAASGEGDRALREFLGAEVSAGTAAPAPAVVPLAVSQPSEAPVEGETAARASAGRTEGPRRTLTPNEYDAAWHAVEGAAGEEGADPGTILHAVLNRLGIDWQDAARPAVAEEATR